MAQKHKRKSSPESYQNRKVSSKSVRSKNQTGDHYLLDESSRIVRTDQLMADISSSYENDELEEDVLNNLEEDEAVPSDAECEMGDPDGIGADFDVGIADGQGLCGDDNRQCRGFTRDVDAILVVDGRCFVEEDLGRIYYQKSRGRRAELRESVRTKVYRAIAECLNELAKKEGFSDILSSPKALADAFLKGDEEKLEMFSTQKKFSDRNGLKAGAVSSYLNDDRNDAILEWTDGMAFPLRKLFGFCKKNRC